MRSSRLSPYGWFSLFLVLTLVLAGCAGIFGGGSAGTGATRALMAGSVNSQITSTRSRELNYTGMTIRTSVATTAVRNDGSGGTMIYNGGPQFAEVLDTQGRTVFAAYVSSGAPNFNVNSTAIAIGYLALAGPGLKADGRIKLLEEMPNMAGFTDLVDAIGDQHDAQGYLDLEAAPINAALVTLNNAAYNRGRGVLATPTTASGLSLNTTVDSQLGVQNTYLRRVELWFRRSSYIDAQDVTNNEVGPWTKVAMPMVGRYGGITGTIDGYLQGEVAYSPVDLSPPLSMPRFPATAKRTTYELFAMGPGLHITQDFINAPLDVKAYQPDLELKALFLDAFLVFFSNVAVPLGGDQVDDYLKFVGANAVITDIIGTLKSTIPDLGDLINQGQYAQAVKKIVQAVYTSNTILPALSQLTIDFLEQNANLSNATYDQIFNAFSSLLQKMGKIDIGFTLADLAILFNDIRVSNKIDRFELVVTPGKVTLAVGRTPLRPTQKTTITATIQDKDPAGVYEYRWRVSPNNNYWLDDRNLDGTDDAPDGILITGDNVVEINSFITTQGTASVVCEVWRKDGGLRKVAESDPAQVVFDPAAQNVVTGDYGIQVQSRTYELSLDWAGRYSGNYAIFALVPKTPTAFYYRFTGTGATTSGYNYLYGRYTPIPKDVLGVGSYAEYLTAPPTGFIKLMLKSGWDGVVGGHSTQAAAQARLQSIIDAHLIKYNAMTHKVEAYLPDN